MLRPLFASLNGARICVWIPVLLCLGFAFWPESGALSWQALRSGQLWRLWTGHWVHYSLSHFAFDTAALFLTALAVVRSLGCRAVLQFTLLGLPLLSGLILITAPGLITYRGASAWAVAQGSMAGRALWRQRQSRPWIALAAAVYAWHVAGQIWPDLAWHGAGSELLPTDVRVVWQAHVAGAVLGWRWVRGARP